MNANHEAWKARFARQCADIDKLEREIEALGSKLVQATQTESERPHKPTTPGSIPGPASINAAATGTRSRAGVVPCPIPVAAAPDQRGMADAQQKNVEPTRSTGTQPTPPLYPQDA